MTKRIAVAAFAGAVIVQLLILIAVPARKVITRSRGRTVVLKVQPMGPYDSLSGFYVMLGLEISRRGAFDAVTDLSDGEACFAVIERGDDGIWKPLSLERALPSDLPENRAVVAGRVEHGQLKYGIENFYIPEAQRNAIADDLKNNRDRARVEVKVDSAGNAALEKLMIEDRVYQ